MTGTGMTWSFGPFSCFDGTCSAIVLTLKPASVSSPTSERSPPYRRSNTRRSRKNASSDWPTQLCAFPFANPVVAASNRSAL